MHFSISQELLQRIVNYLEEKPHKEVSLLLMDIIKEANNKPEIEVTEEKKHDDAEC